MAIEIRTNTPKPKADVAQKVEQLPCKEKVAGSKPAVSTKHDEEYGRHNMVSRVLDARDYYPPEMVAALHKHNERLAYNAAYQRDLRTIKRLGLEITVAAYRKSKEACK